MALIRLADFTDLFPWIGPPTQPVVPRYNIAPSQPIAVVPNRREPRVEFFIWGLIPAWATGPDLRPGPINARAEGLATKPMFRGPLRRRRCLVPVSGFYEWKAEGTGPKTPMFIHMADHRPFALAGVWEVWGEGSADEKVSATIITTEPNELMAAIHNRMPAILPPESYRLWLEPDERDPAELLALLKPYPAREMTARPVSRKVNNPRFDGPECMEAAMDTPGKTTAAEAPGPGTLFG